jgi:two-component system, NtrC family, response regulator AtoC
VARVLVVDDEPGILAALKSFLEMRGDEAVLAHDGAEALGHLEGVDAVICDFAMPGMDGLELLRNIRERDESLPVVLLTAHGSEKLAVKAIRSGAYEYVTKPFDIDEMSLVLDRALEARALRMENRQLAAERLLGQRVVARSAPMQRLLGMIARVAPKDITVLVRGETGTGKEIVASLLHAHSRRPDRPLVRFNCAAIPGELAEAELFGHTRGAFTGATQARQGFFAQAHGGTLVLDEVGELPIQVQAKLLRALQEGEIQPVGSGRLERVDVRVVASTNRDLLADARSGRFREDLYYRLAVVELLVPPLRDHLEDIPELAAEFARRYAERFGMDNVRLSPNLVDELTRASWPGNVRQLENAIARMVALSGGGELGPQAFAEVPAVPKDPGTGALEQVPEESLSLKEQLDALERSLLVRMLAATSGNQSEAARRLRISRSALIERLHKYSL